MTGYVMLGQIRSIYIRLGWFGLVRRSYIVLRQVNKVISFYERFCQLRSG